MSPTRIHKITKIDNYRIFQGWKPSGGVEFARVNLIYGQNGSGKSTLASLLQSCAAYAVDQSDDRDHRHDDVVSAGLQLEVCDPSDTSTSGSSAISLNDRAFWGRVRVFNKDFVRRNLRFEEVDGPQPEALLTIGERLADAERKLEALRPEFRAAQQGLDDAKVTLEAAQKNVGDLGTKVAREIVEDLSGSPEFNARSYNRTKVEDLLKNFEGDPTVLGDASTDLVADRNRATSRAMEPVSIRPRGTMLEQDGLDDARQLLSTSVVSNHIIEELVEHAQRSRWVQQGLDLHEGLESCLFCGQGLTAERINALNAHFDESFKNLQAAIDDLVKRLDVSVSASKTYLDAFPADSDLYEELREDLRTARQTYDTEHKTYVEAVTQIRAALTEKKNNPFGVPVLAPGLVLVAPSTEALKKAVKEHQGRIDSHAKHAREAAARVEHYHVKNAAGEYMRLKKEVEDKRAACEELQDQMKELGERIMALESVDGDPIPGAAELSEGLRGLLGRDELKFSAQDSKHYAIERAGDPATHLSEGEQTAIALLYFLASVRKDKIQGEPPIIIIDDPVSSLDHGILFGASAHIWAEFVVNTYASQVFLLTHNFDLFRHWLIQLESRQQHEDCDFRAYEVTSVVAPRGPGQFPRRPQLRRWETDKDRSKVLRSEYHFLFSRVAHAVVDRCGDETLADQMNALALIPNAARRMLEAFLSFKCPGKMGSFHVAVEEVMNSGGGVALSVRTRVERYLHTYSHFDGGDISQPLKLTEAATVLRSLFQLMDHVDPGHVSSMCNALALEKDKLLGTPEPLSSGGTSA
ncbi:AAA family ATPase [Actinomyces bowdenii]|uniref:AAA family ATPase n=1 Tax=Actinomyces bowdenii TaxID=131109 RepID=A0A853ELD9_9ACTO|nr:AAA family ATPase [Actinomyces bowdenii]MBF0696728.1 AAA family ATPase [Actinomyces bowdenii]NYS68901.1 AAA family ATPase [Actinomyces bowdenii]